MKQIQKTRKMRAYADIGLHGGIFMFDGGNIAEKYPTLLHIYREKIADWLIPVTITYKLPNR